MSAGEVMDVLTPELPIPVERSALNAGFTRGEAEVPALVGRVAVEDAATVPFAVDEGISGDRSQCRMKRLYIVRKPASSGE